MRVFKFFVNFSIVSNVFLVMSNWGKEMAVKEQIPNYISNMKLPEKVKATRLQPLGPDCIISNTEVTDPAIL